MIEISEFFEEKSERTLDELERKFTVEEIQSIVYSLSFIIKKKPDEKIYFTYLGSDETQEIARRRKEAGIEEDHILVPLFDGYFEGKPTYNFVPIDEVPELSKYLRPSRD